MTTPTPSRRDTTPLPLTTPSPTAESFELPMSRYTTPNAPASEFGQLALGSSSSGSSGARMTATTRSMTRRHAASSMGQSSTRAAAGPSRSSKAGVGARNTPSLPPPGADDSDDDSDGSDRDDSQDEGDDLGRNRAQQENDARLQIIKCNVFDLCALTEPNYLVGQELQVANGAAPQVTQLHKRFALILSRQAAVSNAFYSELIGTVRVPGQTWSELMLPRMLTRSRDIFALFDQNVQNPGNGRDVINTAAHLQRLVNAIESITRARYWAAMDVETRQAYVELLVQILGNVIERDHNPYDTAGVPRPPYAGETVEHTNLYRRVIGNPNAGVFLVPLLLRLDPDGSLLVGRVHRLGQIFAEVQRRHTVQSADGGRTARSSPQPPVEFTASLTQLYRGVYRRAQANSP